MAQIKIESVIEHLDTEIRNALEATIKEHFPNQSFDKRQVFRTFKRMVSRKCKDWEDIPDEFIETK